MESRIKKFEESIYDMFTLRKETSRRNLSSVIRSNIFNCSKLKNNLYMINEEFSCINNKSASFIKNLPSVKEKPKDFYIDFYIKKLDVVKESEFDN